MNACELKAHFSPKLLVINGVNGVGIPGGKFTVYLQEDSSELRERVATVVHAECPEIAVAFEVTEEFEGQEKT